MSDLISRSRLIEEIKENQWGWFSREMMLLMLENQPSVTDTNVGGKWIPCKPGDTVFVVISETGEIKEHKVTKVIFGKKHDQIVFNGAISITIWGKYWDEYFNEYIFLTKEEAEQALARMKGSV